MYHHIRRRRTERAQQLMLLSNVPLSQIALACRFAGQAHYCKVFRTVMGLSPNAWRRGNFNLAPDEWMQLTMARFAQQYLATALTGSSQFARGRPAVAVRKDAYAL